MKKLKSVLPSLRERKRYLMYQVISNQMVSYSSIRHSLFNAITQFIGELGMGEAGMQMLDEHYSEKNQTGIIQINNKYLDKLRASFCCISSIEDVPVIVRSVKASGMINKLSHMAG